ncbi:MAG: LamG-like jellyroll fold domain-containing protein [Ekhidna sp.]
MKKFITLIVFLSMTSALQAQQPPFYITPGDAELTLVGSGGGITNPTHYDVYRGTSDPPIDLYRTFVAGFNFQWKDTLVENGIMYYYRVRSRDENSGGVSSFSNVVGAVPIADLGNHYVFDGVDDLVAVRGTGIINPINKLEFRIRIDEVPSGKNMEILRINDQAGVEPNNNLFIIYHTADKLEFLFERDDWYSTRTYLRSTKNIADGAWHSVVVFNLGETHTGVLVDGTEYTLRRVHHIPEFRTPVDGASYSFGTHQMIIGGQSTATYTPLKGAVDDVKLLQGNNLRHHWRFDEPQNTSKAYNSLASNKNMVKENGVGSSFSNFKNIAAISHPTGILTRWNPEPDIQRYEVWRGSEVNALTFLSSVNANDTSFVDTQASDGISYEYQVRAVKPGPFPISNTDIAMPNETFAESLKLDGNGEVQFPYTRLFPEDRGTIEFRFKASFDDVMSTNGHSILNKHDGSGSDNGFNFILKPSNLTVQLKGSGGTSVALNSTSNNLADDAWHHVALTYVLGGTTKLYIDGVEQDVSNATPNIDFSVEPMRLGKSPDSFWKPFKGFVDEVRVWSKVLSDTEVSTAKDTRVSGDQAGLEGVWRFDLLVDDGIAYDDGLNEYDGYVLGNLQVLAPASGSMHGYYNDGEVVLNWEIEATEVIDQYVVTRNRLDDETSQQLGVLTATATSFTDINPIYSGMYEYVVEAKSNGETVISVSDVISIKDGFGNELFLRQSNSDDYVEISETLLNNQTGTIEFRFKGQDAPPSGESYSILNRHNQSGSNNGFNFIHTASNLFVQIKQAGTAVNLSDNENLLDGEWHHVALVYNWNGENQLFVDGELKDTQSVSNISISDEPLRIGLSPDSFWTPFDGSFDELRIWSTQLTGAEINASKDIRLPGNTAGLSGVWHFDESVGTTAYDNGSNNFNGSLEGNAFFYRFPGVLSFSSSSEGFTETVGNGGKIAGRMEVTITGNRFKNPGGVVDNMLYDVYYPVVVGNEPGGEPILDNLFSGLDPVLTVEPDGRSATLVFNGQAIFHEAENSVNSWTMSFSDDVFLDPYPIFSINQVETETSYTLTDNVVPTLTQPIPDFDLLLDDDPIEINLSDYFFDPDFDQNLQYIIEANNAIVSTSKVESRLTFGVTAAGAGSTEISVTLADFTGGEVTDTFIVTVAKNSQTITFNPIPDLDLEFQNTVSLIASSDSELPVQFALISGDGSLANDILTINQTGFFEVQASQLGNETYAAAQPVTVSFNVLDSRKTDQTITFTDDLSGLTYGAASIPLTATASSNLEVTYNTTGPVEINGTALSVLGAGNASVTAIQSGDGDYNPADPVTIDLTIAKQALTATADDKTITFGEGIPQFTVSYLGFVEGDDETAIDGLPGTQSLASAASDAGSYEIEVGDGSDNNYAFEYVSGTLTINKADQVVMFSSVSDIDFAQTNTITLSASSTSGLAVDFTLDQGDGHLVDNVLTINGIGTFKVTASQPGNVNYNVSNAVTQSFTVTDSRKTDQTITFGAIEAQEYGDQLTLGATASSELSITYTLTDGAGSITNGVLTIEGVGDYEVVASQDGDKDFNPAVAVTQQFSVVKSTLTVTADDLSIQEGASIPELTFTYSGFKLADNESVLEVQPAISTTATASSAAGDYPIVLEGGSDDLYELTLINGTLTIESVLTVDDVQLTVYPNPATERLLVKGAEVATMRLLSMEGKLIQSIQGVNAMDVRNLKQGNYILQLEEQNGEVSTHIIIKK